MKIPNPGTDIIVTYSQWSNTRDSKQQTNRDILILASLGVFTLQIQGHLQLTRNNNLGH